MATEANFNYPVAALAALERNPNGVTLSTTTQSITNGQMATLVRRYAAHMELRGVTSKSIVVIALRNGPVGFMLALAAGLLGASWVGMYTHLPFRDIGTTHLIHGPDKPATNTHPGSMLFDQTWATEPMGVKSPSSRTFVGFPGPDSVAYYTRSSGTTGTAKFMFKTAGQLLDLGAARDVGKYKVISPLAPVMASMTFRHILAAIVNGVRVVLPDLRPDQVGQIATLKALGVDYVLGSPAQVDLLCQGLLPLAKRVGTLRVGGAVMDRPAVRHWLGFFEEVILTYGAREGGGGGNVILREVTDTTEFAYTPRPNCEVQVVSEDGQPVAPLVPGILRLRSPTMVTSYVGDASATAEVFRDGWFYPGDIATLSEDGRFTIVGRVKDQINLGGIKFNAAAVDEAARLVDGVKDAICFTTAGTSVLQLSVAVVPSSAGSELELAQAIRRAFQRVNGSIKVHSIYFLPGLPINESGKRERSAIAPLTANYTAY